MGYTIRDYINDEITKQILEVEKEYEVEVKNNDTDNLIQLVVWKNGFETYAFIEIDLDTTLSHIKDYLVSEIENTLTECVGCGKWFDTYKDDEVDLDITDDEYYHSLECLEKNEPQLWNRYCRALGD